MIIKYFNKNDVGHPCEVTIPDVERIETAKYDYETVLASVEEDEKENRICWHGNYSINENGEIVASEVQLPKEVDDRNSVFMWIAHQPYSDSAFAESEYANGAHSVCCLDDVCHVVPISKISAITKSGVVQIVTTQRVYVMSDFGKTIDKVN